MGTFNNLFMVFPLPLGVLFFVAILAGSVDPIADGSGLLTIPALTAAGMSPANAPVTDELRVCGDSIPTTIYLVRRKVVSLSDQRLNVAMTFVGSISDTLLMQYVQADVLRQTLPILVICIGLYFLPMSKLDEEDRQRQMYDLPFMLIASGCVGFYDGFFGPAVGLFYALTSVTLCGFNLTKATAHARLLSATSNIDGLLLFILSGKVIQAAGLVMLAGRFLDTCIGSRLMLSKGQKLIRPMIAVVLAVMGAKLLYSSHGQEILHWLGMNQ